MFLRLLQPYNYTSKSKMYLCVVLLLNHHYGLLNYNSIRCMHFGQIRINYGCEVRQLQITTD